MLRKLFCFLFLLIVSFVMLPVSADAQTATESVVYSFCSQGGSKCTDGSGPTTGLIQASDGNFYGTTESGGATGNGTIFRLAPTGALTTIHNFCVNTGCSDGSIPEGLIQGGDGNLYGVTARGGTGLPQCDPTGCGTVFRVSLEGSFQTLYSFCSQSNCADGQYPNAPIIQGSDGNYYGITFETAFQITPAGVLTTIAGDPDLFSGGLLQGADGSFYGVTQEGGQFTNCPNTGCGTVFSLSTSGSLATIYEFSEGYADTILSQGSDGSLYGTMPVTDSAFKITPSGSLTNLYNFCSHFVDGGCTDGYGPNPLWPGSDGNFYGTTSTGGVASGALCADGGCGTVFQVTPSAGFSSLYSFCGQSANPCNDSQYPLATLVQAADGSFYGVSGGGSNVLCATPSGGDTGCGAIFKVGVSPTLPPPVQLTLSQSSIALGDSVTLNWAATNAFSTTMRQCYAFLPVNSSGAGGWEGIQVGNVSGGIYKGSATIQPTAAGVYTYALTCGGVESGSIILRVGDGKAVTSTVLQAPSSITLDSVAQLTGMTATQQNIGAITGTVAFSSGSLSLGTVSLSNSAASLNVTAQAIPTGTYRVTASYSGDSNYQPSVGTASVTVLGYGTATSLSASTGQVTQGQAVTLSSTVTRTAMSGTPSGSVTFSYGSHVLGTAKVVNGTASFTAATSGSIPPGSYSVTAKYDGDATDQTSVSSPVNVTVVAATATTLTASPMTVPTDSAVALTSVVTRKYDAGVPTGSVTFSAGGHVLGTKTLDGTGAAVVNASSVGIAAGVYPVTATYSGDAVNAASSSAAVDVTVE